MKRAWQVSQGFDNLPMMEKILGVEAFEKVFEVDYDEFDIDEMIQRSEAFHVEDFS